jgi:prevent-host-death family protein
VAKEIAQRVLRNENAKIVDAVAAGETFVITRNGEPVAELRPYVQRRRTFVRKSDLAAMAGRSPISIDYRKMRAEIDAFVDQDPFSRFAP